MLVPLLSPANLPFWTMFLTAIAAVIFGFACYVGSKLVSSEARSTAANGNLRQHFGVLSHNGNRASRG